MPAYIIGNFCSFSSCCSSPPLVSDDLLDCDTSRYKKPLEGNILLFNAAKAGDAKACREQLENYANINVSDRLGQSALMWAAWQGNDEVVKCLLQFDAETRIRTKNNKRNRKKIKLLNYDAESNPKYNPLFAIVGSHGMQVPNAVECINLLLENEMTFVKKNALLLKEDTFGENILHKAVRSGSFDILKFFVDKLKALPDKIKVFHSYLNKANDSGESPLIIAVKNKHTEMVKLLIDEGADILKRDGNGISISELAFDKGNGNYQTYLLIMKARLQAHQKEKAEMKKKGEKKTWVAKYPRKDSSLEAVFRDYHARVKKTEEGNPFWQTYRRFAGLDDMKVEDPELLADSAYRGKQADFFAMLTSPDRNERDLDAINEIISENPFLLECGYQRGANKAELSALEIAIEERDEHLFDLIFSQTNMNRIRRSVVYGDYLKCAIKNRNIKVIEKLLAYNRNPTGVQGHIIESLMSPSGANSSPNPIIEYLDKCFRPTVDGIGVIEKTALLEALLAYYKSAFKSNTSLPSYIFSNAIDHDNEDLLILFYNHSSPKEDFYRAEKKDNRYLQFVLLEKKYFKTLELFMKNSRFIENDWYKAKDPKNHSKTFEEVLSSSPQTKEIQKIISLYNDLVGKDKNFRY